MKKLLLPVLSALLFAVPAFAQSHVPTTPELQKKCTSLTQAMAQELRLSEMAYIKLKELNCERLVKTEEILATYGGNENLLREKMQEVEMAYESSIASFLSPKQLEAYATKSKVTSVAVFTASAEKK